MSDHHPHFGFTKHGLPVYARTIDHHKGGFNKRVALGLTTQVGSMRMFWYFNVLSLLSLPATLVLVGVFAAPAHGPLHFFLTFGWIYLITWICQNYIQLVLLPALMVGQQLQNEANDARAAKSFEDIEVITDRLDTRTQGGITEILTGVGKLGDQVSGLAETVQQVMAARAQHDSTVAADAKRAATAAEGAFVATQALASVATASPGPGELAAAVRENTEAVRHVHQAVTAVPEAPDPGPMAAGGPGTSGVRIKDGSEGNGERM